jgi:acetylornithine deacetylase
MIKIDKTFLTQTLQTLVQTNSVNPDLDPNGNGEAEIGAIVASIMQNIGLEVKAYDLGNNRVNVVGVLRGSGGGKSLMLNAHMDTVGVTGMAEPFSGDIRDGKLYGRGSQDMKGSLAAQIAAAKGIVDAGITLQGDLIIAGVADEEYESIGTDDLVKHITADAAIVTEPTDLQICRAHRGFVWYEVVVKGRAAHGSRYDEGIDANMRMGRFLGELDMLEQELRMRTPHPLTAVPSLHASMIKGGTAISVYAEECRLHIERRMNPGETEAQATAEIQALIDELSAKDPTFKATLHPYFQRSAFEIEADAEIVQIVDRVTAKRLGKGQPHMGASFWTDAAILENAGIPTMLIGPIGAGLHSAEEWVDVPSVVDLAHILAETALEFCRIK